MSAAPDLIADFPGTVATAIHAALPGLRDCRGVDVEFDTAELRRSQAQAPAVLVSRAGSRQVNSGEPGWHSAGYALQMLAIVVTRDQPGLPRGRSAARIAQAVLGLLLEQDWDVAELGPARNIAERPLISADSQNAGVHLIAISWDQPVVLRAPVPGVPIPITVDVVDPDALGLDPWGTPV